MSGLTMLTDMQLARITKGYCPICNHRGFVMGPRGGASINIECGGLECRQRFSVGQAAFRPDFLMGHFIPKQANGGSKGWGTPE